MYYAGIGSRTTPTEVLDAFTSIAKYLGGKGFILRSGGADGADKAFEKGVDLVNGQKEIYLPWRGFNSSNSNLYVVNNEALDLASKYHPYWNGLKPASRKLMARNCYQVLGLSLDCPSDFIICYTPYGSGSGGTGQALRLSKTYNIPVFDAGGYVSIEAFKNDLWRFLQEKYNL